MKNLFKYLLLVAIVFLNLNFTSAKTRLTDSPKNEFTAKVNGKSWKAGVVVCNIEISSMEFFGIADDKNGIKIIINAAPAEGTFNISQHSGHKIIYGPSEATYTLGKEDAGKVIITKYDKERKLISGTFEITLTDAKSGKKVNITNGAFTNLAFYDKPKNTSEFKAKMNGANWAWVANSQHVSGDTAFISCSGSNKMFLHIKFPKNTAPGEYIITADGDISSYYKSYENRNDAGLKAKAGKLIISENNSKERTISGRFEIEMADEKGQTKVKFTDGSFSMVYLK